LSYQSATAAAASIETHEAPLYLHANKLLLLHYITNHETFTQSYLTR